MDEGALFADASQQLGGDVAEGIIFSHTVFPF
jgi:hypothetical protein